ncbi:MAG: hypothetical protein ACTHOC_01360 [Luteimonas sp.]
MEQFEMKPGKGRKISALALAVLCITVALVQRTLSSRLNMCGMLLFAWDIAFIPSPSLRMSLKDIHKMARQGWRMPWISKLATTAAIGFLVAGQYFAFHGR